MPSVITRVGAWRLTAAVAASAAVILSSPVAAELRAALREALGERFATVVLIAVAAPAGIAVVGVITTMKADRVVRSALLLGALAVAVTYARTFQTGNREIDAVEALHFLEYGGITWLFYVCWRDRDDIAMVLFPMLAGVFVGTLDEWFQWFVPLRVGESRDIALDLVACACGLLFSVGADPPRRARLALVPDSRRVAIIFIPLVACTFTLFFQTVQMAVRIDDGGRGVFLSRYTPEQLDQQARDRVLRWRTGIPATTSRFAREDQYLAEAGWHFAWREAAVETQDAVTAAGENAVLERYFVPFLDAPFPNGSTRRLSDTLREDVLQRARAADRMFVSSARPAYPLYVWSRLAVWAVTLLIIAAALTIVNRRTLARERSTLWPPRPR